MKRVAFLVLTITLVLLAVPNAQTPTNAAALTIGAAAPEFELKDLSGQSHSLKSYRGKPAVVTFLSARCPISKAYQDRIRMLAEEYAKQNVAFIGINSSADESIEELRANAAENKLGFTILKDDGNVVADVYAAERTPKVYVMDGEGVLRYRGRIDNSQNPRLVKRSDLREALNEMLAGKSVTVTDTQAMGCLIKRTPELAQSKTAKPVMSKPVGGKPAAAKPATGKPASGKTATAAGPIVALLKPNGYADLLKQSAGKVLIVNFWATWCGPCVAEFPEFVKLDGSYRDKGVRFVHISADDTTDLKTKVVPFLREQKSRAEQFLQDTDDPQEMIDAVFKEWSGALPATFVYDKSGKLVLRYFGIIDRDQLVAAIENALK